MAMSSDCACCCCAVCIVVTTVPPAVHRAAASCDRSVVHRSGPQVATRAWSLAGLSLCLCPIPVLCTRHRGVTARTLTHWARAVGLPPPHPSRCRCSAIGAGLLRQRGLPSPCTAPSEARRTQGGRLRSARGGAHSQVGSTRPVELCWANDRPASQSVLARLVDAVLDWVEIQRGLSCSEPECRGGGRGRGGCSRGGGRGCARWCDAIEGGSALQMCVHVQ